MPELPEVETTRRGIAGAVQGRTCTGVTVRNASLRWPVPDNLGEHLLGRRVTGVRRRAKYLLIDTDTGSVIVHLGMSGRLRVVPDATPVVKHDHVDIHLDSGQRLRLNDARRFGAVLWQAAGTTHSLLAQLGPEPLGDAFTGEYLYEKTRGRSQAIKTLIMDQRVVVGVGNIYANEALHLTGIHPRRAAGRVSRQRCDALVDAIHRVLESAIEAGGTTLRDYVSADGSPGYFALNLAVYDKAESECARCGGTIQRIVLGQRATYFCPGCQR